MEARTDELEWTPEYVARYWDYWSQRTDTRHTYFANQVGEGVANFLERAVPLQGAATLDFGAGPGYLVQHLLNRGAIVSATDYSPETVTGLQQRFSGKEGWVGASIFDGRRLPWPDATFDIVCCLETIEHLLDEHCELIFSELRRVLKPGGTALLTTPNAENLQQQHVYCPRCNCSFHRWQHVRSWSPESLRGQLQRMGFRIEFCEGLSFQSLQRKRLFRPHWVLWWSALAAMGFIQRHVLPNGSFFPKQLFRYGREHLAAVAVKHEAAQDGMDVHRSAAA